MTRKVVTATLSVFCLAATISLVHAANEVAFDTGWANPTLTALFAVAFVLLVRADR